MRGSDAEAMSVRQRMLALARLVDLNCTAQGCSSSSDPHCTEDVEVCVSLSLQRAEEVKSRPLSCPIGRGTVFLGEFCLLYAGSIPISWCCVPWVVLCGVSGIV